MACSTQDSSPTSQSSTSTSTSTADDSNAPDAKAKTEALQQLKEMIKDLSCDSDNQCQQIPQYGKCPVCPLIYSTKTVDSIAVQNLARQSYDDSGVCPAIACAPTSVSCKSGKCIANQESGMLGN